MKELTHSHKIYINYLHLHKMVITFWYRVLKVDLKSLFIKAALKDFKTKGEK